MDFSGFDWNEGNIKKCQKHGVSIAEIELIFQAPLAMLPDPDHSENEDRQRVIGRNREGRMIVIAFTMRKSLGYDLVRPISARYMHRKEIDYYEKALTRT